MKAISLLQLAGAAACLAFASCESVLPYGESDPANRRGSGYSLDNPPSGQSRYLPGTAGRTAPPPTAGTTTPGEEPPVSPPPSSTTDPAPETPPVTSTPPPSTATPPATPPSNAAPGYATPVPGRKGFVYPPGVDAKEENMVDVRDFPPGSKVRHPTKGYIFLVP